MAEVVAALSLATDLAIGQPLEQGLRRTLLVVWLGEELGLNAEMLRDAYYVALLGVLGCTIEVALLERPVPEATGRRQGGRDEPVRPIERAGYLLGSTAPPSVAGEQVRPPPRGVPPESRIMCRDVSLQLGEMLDISPAVREALGQTHELWDGSGAPR